MKDFFEILINLIIADRLKDSLPDNVRNCVITKKADKVFLPIKIAEISDLYINELIGERQAIYIQPRFAQTCI